VKYEDITPTMRAFIGGREAFRKLGFSADNLYCLTAWSAQHDRLACFVQLRAQGKEFNLEVGFVDDEAAFGAEYKRVAAAVNSGAISLADQDRIWEESEVCQNKVGFLMAMTAKGFNWPRSFN
jgi:hypothetical protein